MIFIISSSFLFSLGGASLQLVPIILRAYSSHKEPKALLSNRHKL